jgi:uncharacterized membrane protein
MTATRRLPDLRAIGFREPFGWLAGGWCDLWSAPLPCLAYGLVVSSLLAALCYVLFVSNVAFWAVFLVFGFVFVAPILAMGIYEAGRRLEIGARPRIGSMVLVKRALRQDSFFLGLALFVVLSIWLQVAQVVYGLSTFELHDTVEAFVRFALETESGRRMVLLGGAIGGVMAFVAYTLVVITAPMLLDPDNDVFSAVVTSVRAVLRNPGPMILWAFILASLALAATATAFVGMVIVLPWLGLASWRAYRGLVVSEAFG